MIESIGKKIFNTFFFGNFFAGLCAVALCIETNIQHQLALNGIHFYTIIFLGTSYYYTFLYLKEIPNQELNERVIWYKSNRSTLIKTQQFILAVLLLSIVLFVYRYFDAFLNLNSIKYGQMLLFPIIAFTYTFNILPFPEIKKLRRIGWLKPFIIGFVWSGVVSVYPIIFYQLQVGSNQPFFALPSGWLLMKNFMFISTLCIMFDIKDFQHDTKEGIKTFAVQFGIQKTISFIIIPLILAGISAFLLYNKQYNISNIQSKLLNLIPYILLLITAFSLRKRKSIIYYLSVIDGLMIVKAVCGIAAVYLLNL